MSLYHLPYRKEAGAQNMATDMWLLNRAEEWGGPIFRRYGWIVPQITFGYGQKAAWVIKETGQQITNLTRRPTGGGIVRHGLDLTYCLIVPRSSKGSLVPPMDFYAQIHRRWGDALVQQGVKNTLMPCPEKSQGGIPGDCFNEPVGRDLMDEHGRHKLGGAAMKKTRQGVLVQGTLELGAWPELVHEDLENHFLAGIAQDLGEEITSKEWSLNLDSEREKMVQIYSSLNWNQDRKSSP